MVKSNRGIPILNNFGFMAPKIDTEILCLSASLNCNGCRPAVPNQSSKVPYIRV